MAKVVRDLVAEQLGVNGMVGQEVQLLKLLPSFTAVTLWRDGEEKRPL